MLILTSYFNNKIGGYTMFISKKNLVLAALILTVGAGASLNAMQQPSHQNEVARYIERNQVAPSAAWIAIMTGELRISNCERFFDAFTKANKNPDNLLVQGSETYIKAVEQVFSNL